MEITINCKLAAVLAGRMKAAREELTRRWLDRIAARVEIDPNRIFPTDELLDHVPILMDRIADYLADAADEITADAPVMAKALELGDLRYSQGFDAHQILKEYEILGGVLFAFLVRTVDEVDEPCTRAELLACGQRLFRAVSAIQQMTTDRYLRLAAERVREREARLRSFNRTVSHELKNRIGAIMGAGELLADPDISGDAPTRERFARMVVDNARAMQTVLESLIELSKTDDARQQRHVTMEKVAGEVVRQMRELARQKGVDVRMAPDFPGVEVDAAAMELCLANYLSNAIKYADPETETPWVELSAELREGEGGCDLVVSVRDNGRGVPPEARPRLFSRFYRVNADPAVEGHGLGLNIVLETMEAIGGRAWAEFEGGRIPLSPCGALPPRARPRRPRRCRRGTRRRGVERCSGRPPAATFASPGGTPAARDSYLTSCHRRRLHRGDTRAPPTLPRRLPEENRCSRPWMPDAGRPVSTH